MPTVHLPSAFQLTREHPRDPQLAGRFTHADLFLDQAHKKGNHTGLSSTEAKMKKRLLLYKT